MNHAHLFWLRCWDSASLTISVTKPCFASTATLQGLSPSCSSPHRSGSDYAFLDAWALPSTTSDQTITLLLFSLLGSMSKPFIIYWPCCCLLMTATTAELFYLLRPKATSQLISNQFHSSSKLTQTLWSQGTISGHKKSYSGLTNILSYLTNLICWIILRYIHYFQETLKLQEGNCNFSRLVQHKSLSCHLETVKCGVCFSWV